SRQRSRRARAAQATRAARLLGWIGPLIARERGLGGRAILGRSRLHGVIAGGSRRLGRIGPDGLYVPGELPDLLRRQSIPEGRHSARTAVPDGDKDGDDVRPVTPPTVQESRTRFASSVGVATVAIEPGVELLALTQVVSVGGVGLAEHPIG